MCGRFVVFSNLEALQTHFHIDHVEAEVSTSYNVAPTHQVLSVIRKDDQNVLLRLHWGLVPSWAKDPAIGNRMINARAETVDSKPSFRAAFKNRRCLVLVDGFYEWQGEKGTRNQSTSPCRRMSPWGLPVCGISGMIGVGRTSLYDPDHRCEFAPTGYPRSGAGDPEGWCLSGLAGSR